MAGHHDHHHHHHNITPSTQTFTTAPTVASTLFQAILTTVMSNDHENHTNSSSQMFHSAHGDMTTINSNHHILHGSHGDHSIHLTNSPSSDGHNMNMYFHSGVDAVILFKEWTVSSSEGLLGSVIGIFLMAMLYEGIKFYREHMFKKYFTSLEYSSVAVLDGNGKTVTEVHKVARNRMFSWPHLIQTALHIVQMVLSYFLMLIFMTYNVWLCLGVVLGAGVGYFLFGWKKATVVDITEHCH